MKIKYKGKTRTRIEGYGYVTPGKVIKVPDALGNQLCVTGSKFIEVKEPPIISAAAIRKLGNAGIQGSKAGTTLRKTRGSTRKTKAKRTKRK